MSAEQQTRIRPRLPGGRDRRRTGARVPGGVLPAGAAAACAGTVCRRGHAPSGGGRIPVAAARSSPAGMRARQRSGRRRGSHAGGGRAPRGPGRGQHLHRARRHRAGAAQRLRAAVRALRPALRAARAARARLGRHHRRVGPHRHQQPRDRQRHDDQGAACRRPQRRGPGRRPRSGHRPGVAVDQARPPAGHEPRSLRPAAGRRRGAGDRQPAGAAADRHPRHRQRHRPQAARRGDLREFHPDRCRDQRGQFRRRAHQHAAANWSASTPRSWPRTWTRPASRASASRSRSTWRAG